MALQLTPKQRELLEFVADYIEQHGRPPTFREMQEARGLKTKSAVHNMVVKLEEAGVLRRGSVQGWRSIELTNG